MSASLIPIQQFFDPLQLDFLDGGKVYSYDANSSTPRALLTNASGDTALANPFTLDSYGRRDGGLWGSGNYKIIVKNSDESQTVWTVDNIGLGASTTASLQIGNLLISDNTISAAAGNDITLQTASIGTYQFKGTAAQAAWLDLSESTSSGVNTVTIKAPSAITSNRVLQLPDKDISFGVYGYFKSTSQLISSTATKLTISSVVNKGGGVLSSNLYTVAVAGDYLIAVDGMVLNQSSTSNSIACDIYINGASTDSRTQRRDSTSNIAVSVPVTAIRTLAVNDTVGVYLTMSAAVAANCEGSLTIQLLP